MHRILIVGLSVAALLVATFSGSRATSPGTQPMSRLHLDQVVADSASVDAVAVLVIGPTEILLWDAQYHTGDAKRIADQVAGTGKHLKAIVISHPDLDHYLGAATIVERFPGTPVYMTAVTLEEFNRTAPEILESNRKRHPADFPDKLVSPQVLPSNHLIVDGEPMEVVPDLQGDVLRPSNSFLWIPSLRAVLAGDLVFNGVHPWLGASSESSRAAWRVSLKRIAELNPALVVAGHKANIAALDSPDLLAFMDRYLSDFEAERLSSTGPESLFEKMKEKYPDLALLNLLRTASRVAFETK
jgi:glyoxylase-like metal-dependent hydrolase (beta-lactamase superfamily II)